MKKLFYFLFALFFVSSCNDDDTFTLDTSRTLTMDVDTLSLDTVFSKVPAPTKSFWIHNNSGDGIRCQYIRLEKGNQTGFRVNVDGEYLGVERGYQVNDVEIRKGDSIRVFVEVTTPLQGKLEPEFIEDNLLFALESGTQQKVNLNVWSWDAEMLRNLEVKDDYTLDGNGRPVVVYGGITVDSLATLTIAEGTTLYFHDGAGIDVHGTLKCKGTADANVTLRGDRLDRMFDYLPYDLVSGQWKGLHFHESSYNNEITFTDLHSAYNGVVCDSSDVNKRKLTMSYSTVHNCQGYGLLSINSDVLLKGCQITNTLCGCAEFYGGKMNAYHCTFAQFYPFDARYGSALVFTNAREGVALPLLEFNVVNCIVTGFDDDVVMGEMNDTTAAFSYLFVNSVLRTPEVKDSLSMIDNVWETASDTIVGRDKHFVLISNETQHYDFHLDSLSSAVGAANPLFVLPYDRDGKPYDREKPSAGCYSFIPADTAEVRTPRAAKIRRV